MPNWKNAGDYDFAAKLDGGGWAWEFLRRNKGYRDAYLDLASTPKKSGRFLSVAESEAAAAARERWRLAQPLQDPAVDSPPLFESAPYSPSILDSVSDYFTYVEGSGDVENGQQGFAEVVRRPEFAIVVFDLRQTWSAQVDKAKKLYELRRKESRTQIADEAAPRKPSDWPLYLRLLDARLAGAKPKTVKATIDRYVKIAASADGSNPDKAYEPDWKAARNYCNGWFRFLSFVPPKKKKL